MLTLEPFPQARPSTRATRLTNDNAVDPVAPTAPCKPENPNIAEEEHPKQNRPPKRVAKAGSKLEPAIVPSKRKRGALADITVPNQTKGVTNLGTDSDPKHSKRLTRQLALSRNASQIRPKSVRPNPPKSMKVVTKTHSMTKKTSRQITSQEQLSVKDDATSIPVRNNELPTLCSMSGVNDATDPDQPSQEKEVTPEEGSQGPTRKRRKPSEEFVEGGPTGDRSDLRPCSEELIRAEDGEPDDLDKEDTVDPSMEPEYQFECYQYMRELEVSGHHFF